jgi:hypothetical protein
VQVDVCQDWRNYPTLRRSGQTVFPYFVQVLVSSFQNLTDEVYKTLVRDLFSDDANQYFKINIIKAILDVALYEPGDARPPSLDFPECAVAGFLSAKPVACVLEVVPVWAVVDGL